MAASEPGGAAGGDECGTVPWFQPPAPAVQPAAGQPAPDASEQPGSWAPVRDTPGPQLPCDDCMLLHAQRPDAPLARRARWRYTHRDGTDRILCTGHAGFWGLPR